MVQIDALYKMKCQGQKTLPGHTNWSAERQVCETPGAYPKPERMVFVV